MSALVSELSTDELAQILSGTATSIYRLDEDGTG